MVANSNFERGSDSPASLALLESQRSHMLFVLSNAHAGAEPAFLSWYQGAYRGALLESAGVLSARHFEQHEVDITQGRCPRLPFRYLGLYELSLDGAQEAAGLLDRIVSMHREQGVAPPATWLYYPLGEKVGRAPANKSAMMTVAFANGLPGRDGEFREWYATRHIRHALNIPALVGGQCFERVQFQQPGALAANFSIIAIYEQEGTPEQMLASFETIPLSKFDFPALDTSRFTEWVYRPV